MSISTGALLPTHDSDPDAAPRWEYVTDTLDVRGFLTTGNVDERELSDTLNRRGADGWELVSAFDTAGNNGGTKTVVLIFKRARRR